MVSGLRRSTYARKTTVAMLCTLALTGCQLYWRKPGANLAAFTADHKTCMVREATRILGVYPQMVAFELP
jgi:hypothetical protein